MTVHSWRSSVLRGRAPTRAAGCRAGAGATAARRGWACARFGPSPPPTQHTPAASGAGLCRARAERADELRAGRVAQQRERRHVVAEEAPQPLREAQR